MSVPGRKSRRKEKKRRDRDMVKKKGREKEYHQGESIWASSTLCIGGAAAEAAGAPLAGWMPLLSRPADAAALSARPVMIWREISG